MGKAISLAKELATIVPEDIAVIRHVFETADETGEYNLIKEIYQKLSKAVQSDGRIKLYYCKALNELGDSRHAYELLNENGGISVADLREGDNIITEVYLKIKKSVAEINGTFFDEKETIPEQFDFRMQW